MTSCTCLLFVLTKGVSWSERERDRVTQRFV